MASFRDGVESGLVRIPSVKHLNARSGKTIERYKDGTFGLSYLGFLLYCNGRNPRGLSSNHPNGLYYHDGQNLFGIGVFRREHENRSGHLMLVAPRGSDPVSAIERFSQEAITKAPELKGKLLYVRFLPEELREQFLRAGYHPASSEPWHPQAIAEDETRHHSIVTLADALDLESTQNKWARAANNRFGNFLSNNGIEWQVHDFSEAQAKAIVKDHFDMLEHVGKRIGSTPEDYWNLLEAGKAGRFAVVMSLRKDGEEVPVSVFVGEKVSAKRMALYCTIARRSPEVLRGKLDVPDPTFKGFTALSAFSFYSAFNEINRRFPEIEEVHLGGSETAGLNEFKRKLGAREAQTHWVVKRL